MVKSIRAILKATYTIFRELLLTFLLLSLLLPFVVIKHFVVAIIGMFREMTNEVKNVIWDERNRI